jgi:tripartite-type tricarboxylate transporter receptor subunit TctC
VRALAVTAVNRSSALPDVPTMIESGIPGFNAGVWWALLAPKGTPVQVIQRINTEWGKISKDPEVIEAYARLGVNAEHSTPGKIFEMARAEYPIMGKILKEAGVQAE